jgi:hypothetical protein
MLVVNPWKVGGSGFCVVKNLRDNPASARGLLGRDIGNLEGVGVQILVVNQSMGFEVDEPLTHKFPMGHLTAYARAIVLRHFPTGGVKEVAPKKGPSPAYIGFDIVHQTPRFLVKKNAIPRSIALDDPFGCNELGILVAKRGQIKLQKPAQTLLLFRRDYDSAGPLAAMAAHAAGKGTGCFHK